MTSDRSLWLDAAAVQFGFYRVKDNLDWQHGESGPEDDRSARSDEIVGHANTAPNEGVG